jgi:S1-C subfamily serine protease
VAQDFAEAAVWCAKAAKQGDPAAQYSLAICYYKGEGLPQSYVEAHKWFNLASVQGIKGAAELRTKLERVMSVEQIAEAQRLASAFKAHKSSTHASAPDARISDSEPTASGTGFLISEDGFLITNEHVVEGATQVRLVTSAGFISAKVVKVDAANDLALLKAEGRFAALPVAASRGVKLGGTVATVGFPNIGLQGFAPKLAKGEIASLSGAGDDARYFQISVPVQPGNSGGALVDERGNVVGVVSAKLNARAALASSGALPENVNYAVKSSYLLSFLESVPDVANKLKEPETKERKFEDVVKSAEQAAVLVLVY